MKRNMPLQRRPVLPYAEFVRRAQAKTLVGASREELLNGLRRGARDAGGEGAAAVFAVLEEVIFRCTGLRLFDTQLAAAYSMYLGNVAELPTGEGKTLSAVVCAAAMALGGMPAHVLVFNDYLAERDYRIGRPIYEYCGLRCGFIDQHSDFTERREAYSCDVLYLTVKEAGFDFLRNFLAPTPEAYLDQRLGAALVDEADSILIDEARVPLVLAGESPPADNAAARIRAAVAALSEEDVMVRQAEGQCWLTEAGTEKLEAALAVGNLYDAENAGTLAAVHAALEAAYLLREGRDYILCAGKVLIVEESTGRTALSRRYPDLLQQAVLAKERLAAERETIIYNSIPIQFFLLQYKFLCGMTGTAADCARELRSMYGLTVDAIPPHTPCVRRDREDLVFDTEKEKREAVVRAVGEAYAEGRPVLLGTRSVEESELYSALLSRAGLPHCVLNAANDEEEAALIARAGEPRRVTVSTNMAGRGVDIRLGGADGAARAAVCKAGGLLVIGCGLNRSRRIDRQLRGRAGRQGDPGESRFFVSLEEPLLADNAAGAAPAAGNKARFARRMQAREEGRDAESRYMLEKYAYILEVQRQRITAYREALLFERRQAGYFQTAAPRLYEEYAAAAGEAGVLKAERQLTLRLLCLHWADYLITMENVRNGVHLALIGGVDPIDHYCRTAAEAFTEMETDIRSDVISYMKKCKITADGVDLEEAGLAGGTTTWTYMIDESRGQFSRLPQLRRTLSNGLRGAWRPWEKFFGRGREK